MFSIQQKSAWLFFGAICCATTRAFAPIQRSFRSVSVVRPMMIEHWDTLDQLLQHQDVLLQSTSHFLADASAAVTDGEKSDWWQSYLNIFTMSLTFVHSVLDQPLRNVGFEQTWGVSIAVFTTLIRALLVPVSIQQSTSAEYIKGLKPYINEIKKKYKNNQNAQNRAVAKLYQDAQQNPLAGCLTSLVQLPIFLGLYRGVRILAQEGKLEEPFLWIPSLEGPVSPPDYQGLDWLLTGWGNVDGLPTPQLGWETTLAFLVMPIILVVLQGITMSTLQPPIDENASKEEKETMERTQVVFKFLPLLIGFFSLQVPAGLTIYWFTSNIFTLTQSLVVRAYFKANPPKIELPDYWDMALDENKDFESMTPEDRRKASEAGMAVGPSWQDMQDEARFHVHIERRSFREETEAWKRVKMESIPTEFEGWVKKQEVAKVDTTA